MTSELSGPGGIEASDIFTSQAHLYPILIKRALELAFPLARREEIIGRVLETLEHENDHAAAAHMLGKEVFYAVQIRKTRQSDGTLLPAIWGAIIHQNEDGSEVAPEELEIIVSAPKNLSRTDMIKLGALGISTRTANPEAH